MKQLKPMNRQVARWLLIGLLGGGGWSVSRAETRLIAGRAAGSPGFSALVPITLESDTEVAGIQFDLQFNPERLVGWEIFPGLDLGDQEIRARELAPGKVRVLVYSPASTWLPNGNVVTCELQVAGDAPSTVESLELANPTVASSAGRRITPVESVNGHLAIFSAEFLHDLEDLSLLLQAQPNAARATITLGNGTDNFVIFSGDPAGAEVLWDTRQAPDGRYQLNTTFFDADDQATGEYVREVAVNNDVAWHSGLLSADATWANDVVHVVESTLLLDPNVTLTVQPGAIVKFARGAAIALGQNSTLKAVGAPDLPTLFTSIKDDTAGGDTNLDGQSSLPNPGDWPGLKLQPTSRLQVNERTEFRFVITRHGGTLVADEVWDGTHLHQIVEDLTVDGNATLNIQPGAIIKLEAGRKINVLAGSQLIARGSVAQPIVFTSIKDDSAGGDTNLDGDDTAPAAGDWGWLFMNGGQGVFAHCRIRYGAGPAAGGWGVGGSAAQAKGMLKTTGAASLSLANCWVTDAFYDGVLGWGGEVRIENCVFAGIDRAVSAHPGSSVYVLNSTFHDNRIGLLVHGGTLYVDNTIVANSISSGFQHDFGRLDHLRYCNIWAPPNSTSRNYRSATDLTGTDGNISADPQFKAAARRDFRLGYESPSIDAADGTLAPAEDLRNAPRYTYPYSAKTGVPTPDGPYADQGAYEFAEAAPSDIDLIVRDISGPAAVVSGDHVEVNWVVVNTGSGSADGPWHDALYLVDAASNQRILVGEILVGHGVTLGPGQSYSATAQVLVPGGLIQDYLWLVAANSRGDLFEGPNRENNESASVATVSLDLPELAVDGAGLDGRFDAPDDPRWFKLILAPDQDALVYLDLNAPRGAIELYAGKGYLPGPEAFDARQREWNSPDSSVLVANGGGEVHYLLAYPRSLPSGAASFTIRAATADFMVESVTPGRIGNTGSATLEILGANLRRGTVFSLRAATGETVVAGRVTFVDSSKVFATFPLNGFPAGPASIIADQSGLTAEGTDLLEVSEGGQGDFYVYLTGPSVMRLGRSGLWYVTYGNKGLVDVPLPFLRLSVPNAQEIRLFDSTLNWADSFVLLAMNDTSLLPTLGPGEEHTIEFEVKPGPGRNAQATVEVLPGEFLIGNPESLDWSALPALPGVDPAVWQAELESLAERLGSTLGDYYALLMSDLDDLADDYLGHSYVANINGAWLFGDEPVGATFPLPDIIVSEEEQQPAQGPSVGLQATARKAADGIRKTYFVMIVNTDYRLRANTGRFNLPGTAKDRTDMRQYLKKDLRVPDDQIVDLHDSTGSTADDLSRQKVLNAIKQLKNKIDADDDVVLYYSGHGGRAAGGKGYMWLNSGSVSAADIQSAIDDVGAATTYFVNDSCHSGGLTGNVNPTNTTFVGLAGSKYGRVSWENASGGEFTTRLKKHLRRCNPLQQAFNKAQTNIINAYQGSTNVVNRQSPQLDNKKNVNLNRKPWRDASGFKQQVRKKLVEYFGYRLGDRISTLLVGSFDPNDKVGPAGSGLAGHIGLRQIMPYTVYFENKSSAQAPAQEVLIIDQLDTDLDWSTFELTALGMNDAKIDVPPGLQSYTTTTSVGTDDNPVMINVSLDPATGEVRWLMWSQDPDTGTLPENPFAGFLPPNDDEHRGEGFVSYTVRAQTDLPTGTEILNQARIIFDPTYGFNQPIDTPVVLNTIDAGPPESAVLPLPEESPQTFEVAWEGSDDVGGSGVFSYDIYVSENDGPFLNWLGGVPETSARFTGQAGAVYRFYSVARDSAGNVEAPPLTEDAWTQVAFSAPTLQGEMVGQDFVVLVDHLVPGSKYVLESSPSLQPDDWHGEWEFEATEASASRAVPVPPDWPYLFFRVRSVATP